MIQNHSQQNQGSMKVTLKRSPIGCTQSQRATLNSLGLKRLHQTIYGKDEPALRGQLRKVQHLIQVEFFGPDAGPSPKKKKGEVKGTETRAKDRSAKGVVGVEGSGRSGGGTVGSSMGGGR